MNNPSNISKNLSLLLYIIRRNQVTKTTTKIIVVSQISVTCLTVLRMFNFIKVLKKCRFMRINLLLWIMRKKATAKK